MSTAPTHELHERLSPEAAFILGMLTACVLIFIVVACLAA